jgi:hypothetical protein
MYKITFYVPDVASGVSQGGVVCMLGAGRVGAYDACAWQVKGTGTVPAPGRAAIPLSVRPWLAGSGRRVQS